MTKSAKDVLFWAPRILTILFALFLSVFALDVFAEMSPVPNRPLARVGRSIMSGHS